MTSSCKSHLKATRPYMQSHLQALANGNASKQRGATRHHGRELPDPGLGSLHWSSRYYLRYASRQADKQGTLAYITFHMEYRYLLSLLSLAPTYVVAYRPVLHNTVTDCPLSQPAGFTEVEPGGG